MLELYHWEPNASALSVLICLEEKGLDFTSHYVDLMAFEQHAADILDMNRDGQVPILVHDERVLTESQFINEYLDQVFDGPSLRPDTAENLWRMRVWGKYTGEVLAPAVSTLGCQKFLSPALVGRDLGKAITNIPVTERRRAWEMAAEDGYTKNQLDDSHRKVSLAVKKVEDHVSENEWLVGEDFSLADIEVFGWSNSLDSLTPDIVNEEASPGMVTWLNRMRERPAVGAALAHGKSAEPEQSFAPGPEHSRWG